MRRLKLELWDQKCPMLNAFTLFGTGTCSHVYLTACWNHSTTLGTPNPSWSCPLCGILMYPMTDVHGHLSDTGTGLIIWTFHTLSTH